jgi:hypothetical protein
VQAKITTALLNIIFLMVPRNSSPEKTVESPKGEFSKRRLGDFARGNFWKYFLGTRHHLVE